MHELSPWGHIHPPHLDGVFTSHRGEFRIEALPDGRTRLHGSTWYSSGYRPQIYWNLWCDGLIHAIHQRVLDHVARLAAADHAARR